MIFLCCCCTQVFKYNDTIISVMRVSCSTLDCQISCYSCNKEGISSLFLEYLVKRCVVECANTMLCDDLICRLYRDCIMNFCRPRTKLQCAEFLCASKQWRAGWQVCIVRRETDTNEHHGDTFCSRFLYRTI